MNVKLLVIGLASLVVAVSCSVAQLHLETIQDLDLKLVRDRADLRRWNDMMLGVNQPISRESAIDIERNILILNMRIADTLASRKRAVDKLAKMRIVVK